MSEALLVKELREKTGAGFMDCKKALLETGNDIEKAMTFLREKGLAAAAKKAGRAAHEGRVLSYIHGEGKIGVLVEVNCETDFVARTDEFQNLVRDIAMHIAAASPRYLDKDNVPAEDLEKEKAIFRVQAEESGKRVRWSKRSSKVRSANFMKSIASSIRSLSKTQILLLKLC